jgi:hypothetical protein
MPSISPAAYSQAGGKRHVTVKKLKKVLKKAGLKTSGKKSTLTRRVKKAHLKMRGGAEDVAPEVKEQVAGAVEEIKEEAAPAAGPMEAGRRRSRKGKKGSRKH